MTNDTPNSELDSPKLRGIITKTMAARAMKQLKMVVLDNGEVDLYSSIGWWAPSNIDSFLYFILNGTGIGEIIDTAKDQNKMRERIMETIFLAEVIKDCTIVPYQDFNMQARMGLIAKDEVTGEEKAFGRFIVRFKQSEFLDTLKDFIEQHLKPIGFDYERAI